MQSIRNIAIIAHVDHGKTTLVDQILKQVDVFRDNEEVETCVLDSNDIEKERGITILSKNISIQYKGSKINVIDTPGHADFGGQVERVLKMADGVLLLVDAAEGPMPQTRFVLDKALQLKLKPVVVINKVDKDDARPAEVLDMVYDLFIELGADDEQLEFDTLYGSGRDGWLHPDADGPRDSMLPLLDAMIDHIPAPPVVEGPVQMQVMSLDHSDFVGRIGIGRVYRGTLNLKKPIKLIKADGTIQTKQIKQLFVFEGLERKEVTEVQCGDLCAVVGIPDIDISDTVADAEEPEALEPLTLDSPTISMMFRVNNSPLFGQEGELVNSRQINERLMKEAERDVALHVEAVGGDAFEVSGRGVLHLSILIENMRREGYELSVSQPHVIYKEVNGKKHEPIEALQVEVPTVSAGKVIELVGTRRGEMVSMDIRGERQLLKFTIPTRGMIGLRSRLMTATSGEAIVAHAFMEYVPMKGAFPHRRNGVMISMTGGQAQAYAIDALQQRGTFFVDPTADCYEGMIVGENAKEGDLMVNLNKAKQLTNVRSSGTDKAIKIAPAIKMSLEETLEYIADDELVEVTPKSIRLRKKLLTEVERKRYRGPKK
ncbi:MAG: translational GTPase TypA [Lentisphaeraceae bacterium]|nr:translational GTPase TypA [Lentisphaeraceae bacterium]